MHFMPLFMTVCPILIKTLYSLPHVVLAVLAHRLSDVSKVRNAMPEKYIKPFKASHNTPNTSLLVRKVVMPKLTQLVSLKNPLLLLAIWASSVEV